MKKHNSTLLLIIISIFCAVNVFGFITSDARIVLNTNDTVDNYTRNDTPLAAGVYSATTNPDLCEGTGTSPVVFEITLQNDSIPAFPGAEGAGKWAEGGRGGYVIEVTNLKDNGQGSLRAACDATGARTVVFRVSGIIELKTGIEIMNPYITIAGQTAPGDGICLKNRGIQIRTHDAVIRYIRVRPGVDREVFETDCMGGGVYVRNSIIDHCSTSWASDEGISFNKDVDQVTVQWCIIAENLGSHGYGAIMGSYGGDISYHHNLFIHNISRTPRPAGWTYDLGLGRLLRWDFRNNVIYNWGGLCGYNGSYENEEYPDATTLSMEGNLVGNYYKPGPNTSGTVIFNNSYCRSDLYASGNYYTPDGYSDWTRIVAGNQKVTTPINIEAVTTDDALVAYSNVLEYVGTCYSGHDAMDKRLISEIETGTGSLVANASGLVWPTLNSTSPPNDTDQDGMPDDWETEHGLNPYNPDDRNDDRIGDGYTNLEEYLNSLVIISWDPTRSKEVNAPHCYPNPAQEEFFIQMDNPGKTIIRIYNHSGQLVYSEVSFEKVHRVNTRVIPTGIFLIVVSDEQGRTFTFNQYLK